MPRPTASARHILATDPVRVLRRREVGVGIEVRQGDGPRSTAGTEQTSQHDAAVTPQDEREPPALKAGCDPLRERVTILYQALFVPRLARRANKIAIWRQRHVAEVVCLEPRCQAEFSEDARRASEVSGLSGVIVRADPDARGGSHDGYRTMHRTFLVSPVCPVCRWTRATLRPFGKQVIGASRPLPGRTPSPFAGPL